MSTFSTLPFEEKLTAYVEVHTSPEPEVLYRLRRATHLRTLQPQMLSGHLQGQLLTLLARMIRPQRVLEIGTFTGYSAICFALGMSEGGILDTIERDEELQPIIDEYIAAAGLKHVIRVHFGDAKEIVPTLAHGYDLVFVDADKKAYAQYYEMGLAKLNVGGFMLLDNVLWKGKVVDAAHDPTTAALDALNKRVVADDRTENVLLPIRDGIMLVRKLKD